MGKSKLSKLQDQLYDLEVDMQKVQRKITQLKEKEAQLEQKEDFYGAEKAAMQARVEERKLKYMQNKEAVLSQAARAEELELQKEELKAIVKEIDKYASKELFLAFKEFQRGITSTYSGSKRLWMLRDWYNMKAGEARKLDKKTADILLAPYDNFDWSFGEKAVLGWQAESTGKDAPLNPKYEGIRQKIANFLKLKKSQIENLVNSVKKR